MYFLGFVIKDNGIVVGEGRKTMVLSSLRPYEQTGIDDMVAIYSERKLRFAA